MRRRFFFSLLLLAFFSFASFSIVVAQDRPGTTPSPQCSDTKDNDSDGKIDKNDPECAAGKFCESGATTCNDIDQGGGNGSNNDLDQGGAGSQVNTAGEFPLIVKLKNPLCGDPAKNCTSTIQDAIKKFMDAVVKIAIPFIVVFFIWSGLQFILARGKPEDIKKAKAMFWNTVIGTLLILGAWVITDAIVGTINSIAN